MQTDHYNFVDMTGRRCGQLVVVRRAASVNGNARWLCRCDCGSEVIMEGIRLRNESTRFRNGLRSYPLCCPACRPRRPGAVKRK
jgi:hypothetical protein